MESKEGEEKKPDQTNGKPVKRPDANLHPNGGNKEFIQGGECASQNMNSGPRLCNPQPPFNSSETDEEQKDLNLRNGNGHQDLRNVKEKKEQENEGNLETGPATIINAEQEHPPPLELPTINITLPVPELLTRPYLPPVSHYHRSMENESGMDTPTIGSGEPCSVVHAQTRAVEITLNININIQAPNTFNHPD